MNNNFIHFGESELLLIKATILGNSTAMSRFLCFLLCSHIIFFKFVLLEIIIRLNLLLILFF
jgi:hypothetical protein